MTSKDFSLLREWKKQFLAELHQTSSTIVVQDSRGMLSISCPGKSSMCMVVILERAARA